MSEIGVNGGTQPGYSSSSVRLLRWAPKGREQKCIFSPKFCGLGGSTWHWTRGFPLQWRAAVLCWQARVDGTSRAHPFVQLLHHNIHLKGMLSLLAAVSSPFSFTLSEPGSIAIHSNFYCLLAKLPSKYALRGICEIMCAARFVSVYFVLVFFWESKVQSVNSVYPLWFFVTQCDLSAWQGFCIWTTESQRNIYWKLTQFIVHFPVVGGQCGRHLHYIWSRVWNRENSLFEDYQGRHSTSFCAIRLRPNQRLLACFMRLCLAATASNDLD